MKLHDIIYDKDCYVYSTSYRFCISPFAFAPSTTVAPMNLDFSGAVNITWNRKDRNLLPLRHHEVCEAVRKSGLDPLHELAVLAFTYPKGRPRDGLEILADGATQAGDYFPFSADVMTAIHSFVPTKWPSPNQLQEARAIWSGALAKAQEAKETRQDRAVKLGDMAIQSPTSGKSARSASSIASLDSEGIEMSESTQEELDQVIRIDPNYLKRISERTHKVHCELSDWLTSSSADSKTQIEIWDNLLAHLLKMQPELDAIRSDIQTMSDPTGKFIENEFIAKYGEFVSLSQMRAQIQTALNNCLKPRANDWINHICSQVDVMEQAFKSIFATLEEIVDRNKL